MGEFELFQGENIDGSEAPDGANYGILSPGDIWDSGNRDVTGAEPLIKSGVVFAFEGLGFRAFSLQDNISAISFRYGTDKLPVVPIPSAVFLALLGLGSVVPTKRWLH